MRDAASKHVIVTIPKPGAPAAAWLMEWPVLGPFESYEEADARRLELPPAQGWHRRVCSLEAPAK